MNGEDELAEVGHLDLNKVRRFLTRLKELPFVALIFEEGQVTIYSKDLTEEQKEVVHKLLAELEVE